MTRTQILDFYLNRVRRGDGIRIAEKSGYSESHISNIKAHRRNINTRIANAMYDISYRRSIQVV
jgi:hypothetical protein